MEDLKTVREEIFKIDEELIDLFRRRFGLVQSVAEYKYHHDLPVFDSARETELKQRLFGSCKKEEKYLEQLYDAILDTSKKYQEEIIQEEKHHG